MRIQAPAKLNFGLRITGVRADGYHELDSLFLPLDLADELELSCEPAPSPEVEFSMVPAAADVPGDASNLAVRAAHGFLDAAGQRVHVRLRLAKQVPAAAGLGGGSSDAAAVLRGLAAALPGALDREALSALALRLGADVPFFLDPRPARVTGIGEKIAPLPGVPAFDVVLANPGEPLPTARVFAAWDAGPAPASVGGLEPDLAGLLPGAEPQALGRLVRNDLAGAAEALCPGLVPLGQALRAAGALAVGLSGSGATLYGVFEGAEAAARAAESLAPALPGKGWLRVARTAESR